MGISLTNQARETGDSANSKPSSEAEAEEWSQGAEEPHVQIKDALASWETLSVRTRGAQDGVSLDSGMLQVQQEIVQSASRRLQMHTAEDIPDKKPQKIVSENVASHSTGDISSSTMTAVPTSSLKLDPAANSLAREAYLRRFNGTAITTVFAPGEYHIPE